MKKVLYVFLLALLFLPSQIQAEGLIDRLSGNILIQVESYGRAWYVEPTEQCRYYLGRPADAFHVMRELSLGVSNKDFDRFGSYAPKKLAGKILLKTEDSGKAYYVSPDDLKMHYLGRPNDAFNIMRSLGLGVSDNSLRIVPMNKTQVSPTFTFNSVAYSLLDGAAYSGGQYNDDILPLASLTKVMTAMVCLDQGVDFNDYITVTQSQIDYPGLFVDEKTSEVNFKVGDTVKLEDVWIAMLVASSNQAAKIMAESTGLDNKEFLYQMNKKAQELDLKKTKFVDVAGLDSHNVSTPDEMARIGKEAFAYPRIADKSIIKEYSIPATGDNGSYRNIYVKNRNYSLLKFEPDGAKTGILIEAQRNVVLKKGKKIIVVMHARSMNERNSIISGLLEK